MIELKRTQQKDVWLFSAYVDGVLVATLTAHPSNNDVLIHNQVYLWSPKLFVAYRQVFADFRQELQAAGYKLVIVCSDRCTDKMKKYWRLMGFEFFGEMMLEGKLTPYAVMEA